MDIFAFLFMSSISLVFLFDFSYATDSITQSQSLKDDMTLVSKNGRFELGFFNPSSSKNRYFGSESALPQPKKPGFFLEKKSNEAHGFSSKQESPSINEITNTLLEAR